MLGPTPPECTSLAGGIPPIQGPIYRSGIDFECSCNRRFAHSQFSQVIDLRGDLLVQRQTRRVDERDADLELSGGSNSLRAGPLSHYLGKTSRPRAARRDDRVVRCPSSSAYRAGSTAHSAAATGGTPRALSRASWKAQGK